MSNIDEAAEKTLDKITVGLHHPQFREAIITCMKEFGEWRLEQFKAEQKSEDMVSIEEYEHAVNKIGQLEEQLREAEEYINDQRADHI